MRIKLDENLPLRLVDLLSNLGHEVDTVLQEGLSGQDDPEIWEAAQQSKRFLITQDLDFSDVHRFVPGTHFGVLLVRLKEPGREALVEMIHRIFQTDYVEGWGRCFVVATKNKIRVRRPV